MHHSSIKAEKVSAPEGGVCEGANQAKPESEREFGVFVVS
jgi:hypothetical protein